jgi:hypothetical protein
MAFDFTFTSPTTVLGSNTPSRAFTLTVTGSGSTGSVTNFALSDNGAGGFFWPATPTIASGSSAGAVVYFFYIPPTTTAGPVAITVTASGGISATHVLSFLLGSGTVFVQDTFAGTAGTPITAHTSDSGATWVLRHPGTGGAVLALTGSGGIYNSTAIGQSMYYCSAQPAINDFDLSCTCIVKDNTISCAPQIVCDVAPGLDSYNGYILEGWNAAAGSGNQGWYSGRYNANTYTPAFGPINTPAVTPGTFTALLAVRVIGVYVYSFSFVNGSLLNGGPVQDTSGGLYSYRTVGVAANTASGTQTSTSGVIIANLSGRNVDWKAPPFTGAPLLPTS